MRIVNCIICKQDFDTNQKGVIKTCSLECRNAQRVLLSRKHKRKEYGTGDDVPSGIYFGNAKEPLMPAGPGEFGYLGVISYNKNKDKIQCHICGKFFRSLGTSAHLKVHNITNDEYKERFGIARTVALVSEGTREKHLQSFMNRTDEWIKDIKEVGTDEQRAKNSLGKKRRIYTRNKTGHCPLQLLEPIKALAEKLGGTPNGEDFKRAYRGKYMSTIVQIYGSFNEALKVAGFEPRPRKEFKYTEGELIEFLQNFYKMFGRTPAHTDFNRGYLPAIKHYIKRFGGINRARAIAGIPLMVPVGGWRWAEVPLTAELRQQLI